MKTHGFLVKYEPTTKTRGRREKEQAQTTKANDENKANAILRILYSIVHVCVFDSLIFDYLIIEHTSRLVDKGTSPGDFGLLLWTGYNSGLLAGPVTTTRTL